VRGTVCNVDLPRRPLLTGILSIVSDRPPLAGTDDITAGEVASV